MNKLNIVTKLETLIEQHSAAILTGIAIGGVFLTAGAGYFAASKTAKVTHDVKKSGCEEPTLTIIKKSWKYYIPTGIAAGITIAAIVGLNVQHKKAYTALLAAYTASNNDLKSLKDNAKKIFIKDKTKTNADVEQRKKVINSDPHQIETIRDMVTGLEIKTSKVAIITAADMVNQLIAQEGSEMTYIDFLDFLGYKREIPEMWEHIGWKIDGNSPIMNIEFGGDIDENYNTITTITYKYDWIELNPNHMYID